MLKQICQRLRHGRAQRKQGLLVLDYEQYPISHVHIQGAREISRCTAAVPSLRVAKPLDLEWSRLLIGQSILVRGLPSKGSENTLLKIESGPDQNSTYIVTPVQQPDSSEDSIVE